MTQPIPTAASNIPDSAVEAFRAAYASHGSQKGYAGAIRAGLAAAAPQIGSEAMQSLEQASLGYLVHQLDVALNGTDAAAGPSLADLVSQCEAEAAQRHGPILSTLPAASTHRLLVKLHDLAEVGRMLQQLAANEAALVQGLPTSVADDAEMARG